jgi:hypothetical protein
LNAANSSSARASVPNIAIPSRRFSVCRGALNFRDDEAFGFQFR